MPLDIFSLRKKKDFISKKKKKLRRVFHLPLPQLIIQSTSKPHRTNH